MYIKEEKYGYDLKHFPCLKLNANYSYGQLAMVAHNILRWVAIMTKPEKPHFSKKLKKAFYFYSRKNCTSCKTSIFKTNGISLPRSTAIKREIEVKLGKIASTVLFGVMM